MAASGVLVALGEALSDGGFDTTDLMQVFAAAALAFGVYRVPNAPSLSPPVPEALPAHPVPAPPAPEPELEELEPADEPVRGGGPPAFVDGFTHDGQPKRVLDSLQR